MTEVQEIWLPIKGYEGIYEVSNLGNVKSIDYRKMGISRVLKQGILRHGYRDVALWRHKSAKYPMIHRLVAQAFIPNPDSKSDVNHINGDKADNRVENLEWCTRSENIKHAYRIGLSIAPLGVHGEKHWLSKITEEQAIEIFNAKGYQKDIGRQYGVSRDVVNNIKTGRSWKHLNLF